MNYPERLSSLGGFLGESPSIKQAFLFIHKPELDPAPFGQISLAEEQVHKDAALAEYLHRLHWSMMIGSMLVSAAGIYLAYLMHLKYREAAEQYARKYAGLVRVLQAKYWVDEIYQNAIVEPLRTIGRVCVAIDNFVIDSLIWIISFVPQATGFVLKLSTQRGYLQGYAATMLLGVVVILLVVFLS